MLASKSKPLAHIGWPKVASTQIQRGIARLYPGSRQVNRVVYQLHEPILEAVMTGQQADMDAWAAALAAGIKAAGPGGALVSDERISVWRGVHNRKTPTGAELNAFRRVWAQLLARAFPGHRILILCRRPESWLHSQYAQDVKCGARHCDLSFRDWCGANADILLAATDIQALHDAFAEHFGADDVVVLTHDHIRTRPERCIQALRTTFGLPVPDDLFSSAANSSLPPRLTEGLRSVQQLIGKHQKDLNIPPEKANSLRDHLFWFINHAAVTNADFSDYMKKEFLEPGAPLASWVPNLDPEQDSERAWTVPPGLLAQMELQYDFARNHGVDL